MACEGDGEHSHAALAQHLEELLANGAPMAGVTAQVLVHAALLAVTDLGRLVVRLAAAWEGRALVEQALSELVAGDRVQETTWRALDKGASLNEEQRHRLLAALEVASQRFQLRSAEKEGDDLGVPPLRGVGPSAPGAARHPLQSLTQGHGAKRPRRGRRDGNAPARGNRTRSPAQPGFERKAR